MNIGLIIIGNEILSCRFADANSAFLTRRFFERGARVREIATLPDEIPLVAAKINEYRERFDLVVTTGGIGPTHDDITFEAVALAFQRPLEPHPELVAVAREKIGRDNAAIRKLTCIPAGAELLPGGRFIWPPVKVENVIVLPGVPRLIEAQFSALEPLLPDRRHHVAEVRCKAWEVDLAETAETVANTFPDVELGSYPIHADGEHYVLLRLTGTDADRVHAARTRLLELLPADVILG